jgi:large subunit ribosomal protein L22
MEFRAEAKYMRVSPQKVRLVLDMIKGRRVEEAMDTLAFTNKGCAPELHKLLRSALENANYLSQEKGLDVDVDRLFVKRAVANEGPRFKRIRPAPMGRAFRYQRRMSHIEIALEEKGGGKTAAHEGGEAKSGGKAKAKAKTRPAGRKPAGKK